MWGAICNLTLTKLSFPSEPGSDVNSTMNLFRQHESGPDFLGSHANLRDVRDVRDVKDAMVDLAQDQDLQVWTGRLSCSAEKLLAAVESVGPRVEHVTEYLRAGW